MNSKQRDLDADADLLERLDLQRKGEVEGRPWPVAVASDDSFCAVLLPGKLGPSDLGYLAMRLHFKQGFSTILVIADKISFHAWGQAENLSKQGCQVVLTTKNYIRNSNLQSLSSVSDLDRFPQKRGTHSLLAGYVRRLRYSPALRSVREQALHCKELDPNQLCEHMAALVAMVANKKDKEFHAFKWPDVQRWGPIFRRDFSPEQRELLTDILLRGGLSAEEFREVYECYTSEGIRENDDSVSYAFGI